MMNLDEIIARRKSVRSFKAREVPEEMVGRIIESARPAPSAVNFQPWRFYICFSDRAKEVVRNSYPREWFAGAPLYIVACGNHDQAWKRPSDGKDHTDVDVAIAVEQMVLKITELGLGTCWVCNFDTCIVKEGLSLETNIEPIVLLPIGYPADDGAEAQNKKRKPTEEIAYRI